MEPNQISELWILAELTKQGSFLLHGSTQISLEESLCLTKEKKIFVMCGLQNQSI